MKFVRKIGPSSLSIDVKTYRKANDKFYIIKISIHNTLKTTPFVPQ